MAPQLFKKKGQALVLLIFTTAVLLAVSGLAVDTANLSSKRSILQKAVDAAAVSGISYYASSAGTVSAANAQQYATDLANYSLARSGIPSGAGAGQAQVTSVLSNASAPNTMTVTATMTTPTFFMRLLGVSTGPITATATASRSRAVIALVLDVSASMSEIQSGQSKFQAMQNAVNAFVATFQPNYDYMSVITFNHKTVIKRTLTTFASAADITNVINALPAPSGETNVAEGIATARQQMDALPANVFSSSVKAIVLLSDGAPNTIRANFTNSKGTLPPNGTGHDYLSINRYTGPNHCLWINKLTLPSLEDPYSWTPPCHQDPNNNNPYRAHTYDPMNCLNTYAYQDSMNVTWGSSIAASQTDISTNPAIMYEAYNLAIREADYAKNEGITIYVLGFGNYPGIAPTPTCPPTGPTPTPTPTPCPSPQPTPVCNNDEEVVCMGSCPNTNCYCSYVPPTPTPTPTPTDCPPPSCPSCDAPCYLVGNTPCSNSCYCYCPTATPTEPPTPTPCGPPPNCPSGYHDDGDCGCAPDPTQPPCVTCECLGNCPSPSPTGGGGPVGS